MQGPILVSLSSFMVYALLGKQMSAAMAFPALALFNLLRQPLMMLPNYINSVINAKVSIGRLQTYLQVGGVHLNLAECSVFLGSIMSFQEQNLKWPRNVGPLSCSLLPSEPEALYRLLVCCQAAVHLTRPHELAEACY